MGAVCSVDRSASEAGFEMLRRGGNAVDAAIATNAVLAVTSPHLCGMGGDLFALLHDGEVTALNASGRAGSGASAEALRQEGHEVMPLFGDIRSVPVPGCVDGWVALHEHARLPMAELLAPAVELATRGFQPSPLLAPRLSAVPLHVVDGLVVRPGVARALQAIASDGRDGFYRGDFGRGLLALGRGEYDEGDLVTPSAEWVEPLSRPAFGHTIWTMPPNSQGYLLLLALGIAEGLDLPDDTADPLWAHLLVEASRAAGHDREDVLYDGATPPTDVEARRALVDPGRRSDLVGLGASGGTTYLCTWDDDGLGVSLIQSNALGFGSQLWEPTTGINLQNRGIGFSLREGHPAEYAAGRRPPHTLVPGLVTRPDGTLRTVIGSMGGDAQPQVLLQLLTRLLRHGETARDVIAAPRWRLATNGSGFDTWRAATHVAVEDGGQWAAGLRSRGHEVRHQQYSGAFGHAHLIDAEAGAAADPRAVIGAALQH